MPRHSSCRYLLSQLKAERAAGAIIRDVPIIFPVALVALVFFFLLCRARYRVQNSNFIKIRMQPELRSLSLVSAVCKRDICAAPRRQVSALCVSRACAASRRVSSQLSVKNSEHTRRLVVSGHGYENWIRIDFHDRKN